MLKIKVQTIIEQSRTILFGENAIHKIPELLKQFNAKKVMIVSGKSVVKNIAYKKVTKQIGKYLVGEFNGVLAHVPESCVKKGLQCARLLKIDTVISIGGGSAIDCAKAISLKLSKNKTLLHIAIPTTLSAAECTNITGITIKKTGIKRLYSSSNMAPRCIIYDPLMTDETPNELWLSTALRTLDHAIERSYSLVSTPLNDALCLHATRLIFEWLPKHINHLKDSKSRLMLMHAAFLSMSGPSGTCLSHAIGHQLGPRYINSQFDSTAVTQPVIMAYNRKFCAMKQKNLAIAMGLNVHNKSNIEAAKQAEYAVQKLIKSIEKIGITIPHRIRDTGIIKNQLPEIATAIWASPRLKNNPRPIKSKQEIIKLLNKMW